MEKDKSRGLKHRKDKTKYKGNSTKNQKYIPPKSKPNLESNWDRYEQCEESDSEENLGGNKNFAFLANAPISIGSHSQAKTGVNQEEDTSDKLSFSLNLDLLHQCVLTFPFYERLHIDQKYFKHDSIEKMNQSALKNLELYHKQFKNDIDTLESDKSQDKNLFKSEFDLGCVDESSIVEDPNKMHTQKSVVPMELLQDSSIKSKKVSDSQAPQTGKEKTCDLEEWLDDILDE